MLNIELIKVDNGYYIREEDNYKSIFSYYINGSVPEKTFHEKWGFVKKIPTAIEVEKSQPSINYRYELIDETFESDKLKKVFLREEIAYKDDYEWYFKEEYSQYQSLYKYKYDTQPQIKVPVEFTITTTYVTNTIEVHDGFSFPVEKVYDYKKTVGELTEKSMKHSVMDRILFPELVLSNKRCVLSSKHTFDIIRQHVRANLNGKYAKITSDYDFCFTVKKSIALSEPVGYDGTPSSKKHRDTREVEVFEMTHDTDTYKGYTIIKGFEGKSQTDLKNNIDNYLKELMIVINKPLVNCKHCNGTGVESRESNE